jgi:chaperonin cofactor prefoldin
MALSKEQREMLLKVEGGQAILDEVDKSLKEVVEPLNAQIKKLTGDDMNKRKYISELREQLKAVNLDPDDKEKPLAEQIEALQTKVKETATKGFKPNAEFEALQKEIKKTGDALAKMAGEKAEADKKAKMKTAQAAYSTTFNEIFGLTSKFILDEAINKGIITVSDADEAGVMDGDTFLTGDEALASIKKKYSPYVVTNQRKGSGNTPPNGGSGAREGKTMSNEEYNQKVAKGEDLSKFFADGGQLVD